MKACQSKANRWLSSWLGGLGWGGRCLYGEVQENKFEHVRGGAGPRGPSMVMGGGPGLGQGFFSSYEI